ncbi:MAG: type II toxin-antitoxin system HicA family toxin [Thermoanaerobaculia bacterium]
MRPKKLLERLTAGALQNVRFEDLVVLLEELNFRIDRVRGSHFVFVHPRIPAPLPLQPIYGQAKPYQLRQVLRLVREYNLTEDESR